MTFLQILRREWGILWKGRFPVAPILFLLPLAFTLAFGIIYYQNSVERIPLIICDEEQSPVSRTVIQAYSDSEKFSITGEVYHAEDMTDALQSGSAIAALYIPADLSKKIKTGDPIDLLILVDSANNMFGNAAMTAANEINKTLAVGIASQLLEAGNQLPQAAMSMAYPVRMGIRIINNPTTGYSPFMLAGLTMNGLQIAIMLVICPLVAREFHHRVYRKQVPSWKIIAAKILPVWGLSVLSFFVSLIFLHTCFAIPARGSFFDLGLIMAVFTLTVSCIMTLFAVCSPDEVMSLQEPLLYIMPGLLYSGLSWPDFYMNQLAEVIAFIFPMRHGADVVRDLLLSGYAPALYSQCLQMLLMGGLCLLLAWGVFIVRRRYGTVNLIHHVFRREKGETTL